MDAHYSVTKYTVAFVLSVVLTGVAYIAVTKHLFDSSLITVIVALASAQVLVQLFFFLHLGQEAKPRWKLGVFIFMLIVLGILVYGSLWIMQNLNYHMQHEDMNTYIIKDEGIQPHK
jgi:cytochrome o ubiquinol oxidase operon protein cyoD